MTFIHLVIPSVHETECMQIICLINDVLLQLPEEWERHDEGNSQITEDAGCEISEEIRKQQ